MHSSSSTKPSTGSTEWQKARGLERSFSCNDLNNDKNIRPKVQRRHSWNGTSLWEKKEMERFFLQDNQGDNGKENKASYLRKAKAAIIGGSLVGVGILMIPLPGPGIVVMAAGGTVLAKEFPEAQRAMDSAKGYCASVLGGKDKDAENDGASNHATNDSSTASKQKPNTKEDRAKEYEKKISEMGRSLEDGFYKGFAKAYIGTEKASKKIGLKFEQLTAKHMTRAY